ncbi:MAG: nitrilase family protein [Muribaculum sp.]|nr:nitrilase family protein [Muribaculum sp.]
MNKNLKVAAIQLDIAWTDIEQNLIEAERSIVALPQGCDIAVLPEMFTTGFIIDRQKAVSLSETGIGPTLTRVTSWAKRYNMAVCGSYIAREADRLYNRAFFVEPSGDMTFYDKHHLFAISGEDSVYSEGSKPVPVIRFRGWNIAIAVCFDLRFPAWLRNVNAMYDLLILTANWPDSRAYPWEILLAARAIENQACVVGCNRAGADDYGVYSGTSAIFDSRGQRIAGESANGTTRPFIVAELSKSDLERFRTKFPVLQSMDTFTITEL